MFDEIMVSTDDEEIAELARQFGAQVPFMRSPETANDFATTVSVLEEVLTTYENNGFYFENICCLYSTAPFVSSEKLINAFKIKNEGKYDSVMTVVQYSYPIQRSYTIRNGFLKMQWPEYSKSRSQDLEITYHDAGQFYITSVEAFKRLHALKGENTGAVILSELEVQDLDTTTDWKLAEMKYKMLSNV